MFKLHGDMQKDMEANQRVSPTQEDRNKYMKGEVTGSESIKKKKKIWAKEGWGHRDPTVAQKG